MISLNRYTMIALAASVSQLQRICAAYRDESPEAEEARHLKLVINLMVASTAVYAQETTGTIRGDVFDSAGNLWISTDGNALKSNDGLFAVPVEGPYRGRVKQFLTVPKGAETCGPVIEDDFVLVSVQHPGEVDGASAANPLSHWPDGGTSQPRPSVVAVWKKDKGRICG